MMRRRLRSLPRAAEMALIYALPHRHDRWDDHVTRVDVTSSIGMRWCSQGGIVADLSCGDGEIACRIAQINGGSTVLGDYAPGYPITGPIEETVDTVPDGGADLWVCCETIEHLDDPDAVLAAIRAKARWLLLSTPEGDVGPGNLANIEHLWAWDSEAVEAMCHAAGWSPQVHAVLDFRPSGVEACYQIWMMG
jgi:hypothetical protein